MSLNLASTDACPMLLGSDVLSLPPDYEVRQQTLYDTALQATHVIRPPGQHLIVALVSAINFQDLQAIAQKRSVTLPQLYDLLATLHSMGALRRQRSTRSWLRACMVQTYHFLYGIHYAPYAWRAIARPGTIVIALLRASWPLIGACGLVCILLIASGWLSASTVVIIMGAAIFLFWTSLYGHELTHAWLIRRQHYVPVIVQRGQRFTIIHRHLHCQAEIITALAGPAAGLAICSIAMLVCSLAGYQTMATPCLLIGIFHLSSLLPRYGDGATLISAITKRYHYAECRKTGSKT